MSTKLRQLFTRAALLALVLTMLGSTTSAFDDQNDGPSGSWLYTVTIPGFASFLGVETYSADGGYTETDQLSFNPSAVAGAGHGAWQRGARNTFVLTYVNLTFDGFSSGQPTGFVRVRQRATIDRTRNSYSGSGDYTYYDLNGDPIPNLSGTFTIVATRILVQAPAN